MSKTPWMDEAKKHSGKKESDPSFNKFMSSKWKLVGLNLGTIQKNWAAWCGLFIAVSLAGAGYSWHKRGASARNWAQYGVEIEFKKNGMPRGAIVHLNMAGRCDSGSNNHVTFSDGDCTAQDLNRRGGTFRGYGGNQGNMAKVSTYPVAFICNVRFPKEAGIPPKVLISKGCVGSQSGNESTR